MQANSSTTPNSPAQIVPANWRDLGELRRVERACFLEDTWPLLDLIGVLTVPGIVRLKATIDGQMVGFIAGDVKRSQGTGWITTVCVLPDKRGKGIGAALLQACEDLMGMPRVRLSVRVSNQRAIQLYEQSGYHKVDIWTRYYQDGEDALIMEKLVGKRLPIDQS